MTPALLLPASLARLTGAGAALLALAPALPHPLGTVRHVPDPVGAVLTASAVAAGVLAGSRGSAWGRLSSRAPACAAGCAGVTSTGAVLGGAIGVTGATVLIGRPFVRRPVPGHASVLVAVLMAAALLAATALVRVAGASGRETGHRSQRAAEGEPAVPRRLPARPRRRFDHVRSEAAPEPARFAASDSRVVNPL
jgi:hypothetical protein